MDYTEAMTQARDEREREHKRKLYKKSLALIEFDDEDCIDELIEGMMEEEPELTLEELREFYGE